MNSGPAIFLAAFVALATSWFGFVLAPQLQLGRQPLVEVKATGEQYPSMRAGLARQGEQVYRANGCFYCHSQQVRPQRFGGDVERGWGGRAGYVQSVNQDYLYDYPVMLGSQRVGPDLTNFGLRQTNENTILRHLYNPRQTMPGSVMPPYRYLFQKHTLHLGEKESAESVDIGSDAKGTFEILPSDQATALVAYLLSLHSTAILYETPPPQPPPTNAAPAIKTTNAGAAATTNKMVK